MIFFLPNFGRETGVLNYMGLVTDSINPKNVCFINTFKTKNTFNEAWRHNFSVPDLKDESIQRMIVIFVQDYFTV